MSFLKRKKIILVFGILVFIAITGFKFLQDKFVIGFRHPESAYFNGRYIFVSNIGSSSTSKNKDGFITKLDQYGNILEYKFIDNLQAPKGIWLNKNILYIADLNRVCEANINTKRMHCIGIAGSMFLNDIIYHNKKIYVTDTLANNIYVINAHNRISVFFHKNGLSPNGIAFSTKLEAFLVVSFNKPIVNIISVSGTLIKSIYFKDFSGFDGIVVEGNKVFMSDYRSGKILESNIDFRYVHVVKDFKTPASDIFLKNDKLIVPLLEENKLYIGRIK